MTREDAINEWTFRSNHIKKWLEEYGEEPSIRHYVELIDMAIEALQTEVVRCKDCIHYESDGGALMVCRIDDMVVDDTDYCSHGERKGGDDE